VNQPPQPWSAATAGGDVRKVAPAVARNRDAILAILQTLLPPSGTVLEIASGSGEHIVHFAAALPALRWQPSDPDETALASIAAWVAASGVTNVQPPLRLDASSLEWPVEPVAAMLCINMVHISEWAATEGLFRAAATILSADAPLILYGPYREDGVETASSNLAFDQSLRERNPAWGLRNVADLDRLATAWGMARTDRYEMPANNLTLVYQRQAA
jgi:Protein of unknown function (DUF938)